MEPVGVATPTATAPTGTPPAFIAPLSEADSAPVPAAPDGWRAITMDSFDDNTNGWVVSQFEDDWGSTRRAIEDGTYRWEIDAEQAVSRWCTPELAGGQAFADDYLVSVEVQRLSGPESAAYGLVLRHTEGSYYLFSVRDDGYFLFSLWDGTAWQPIIDWTQTLAVVAGDVNQLSAKAEGASFELYINGALVHQAQNSQLCEGEAVSRSLRLPPTARPIQFRQFRRLGTLRKRHA